MTIKTVTNADGGTPDIVGGDDWDNLASGLNLGEAYMYLVKKSGSTYYVKNSAGEIAHSGATPATEIQWALNNLTVGRTWPEIVAIRGSITFPQVTIPSYTAIDMRGALLTQSASAHTNMFINSDTSGGNTNIEIFGGVIEGNKANQTEDGIPYDTRNTINLTKVTNGSIHDMTIQNSNANGVYADDCTNVSVHNCNITAVEKLGIYFHSTTLGSGKFLYARNNYIAGQDENPLGVQGPTDVWLENNVCDGNTITNGINCNGSRMHINGNYIRDMQYSGIIISSEGTHTSDETEICNNKIENCALNAAGYGGISVGSSYPSDRLVIKGNKVKGPASGSTVAIGIRLSATENSILADNIVWNWSRCGIFISGSTATAADGRNFEAQKIDCHDNICFDNGQYTTETNPWYRSGITVRGGSYTLGNMTGINIHDNICYDNGAATQRWGLSLDNCDDIWIYDNDLRGNTLGAITMTGTIATSRIQRNHGYVTENSGTSTQSGNGSTKVFNIAHGLVAAPTKYMVVPGHADSVGPFYVTADATNVIVTYPTAPSTAASNVVLRWVAEVI